MKDEDYIRKAIELADGWSLDEDHVLTWIDVRDSRGDMLFSTAMNNETEYMQATIDALAAQLVRQVDALNSIERQVKGQPLRAFSSDEWGTARVWASESGLGFGRIAKANDEDRTMNTIKAIVDSKVLEND